MNASKKTSIKQYLLFAVLLFVLLVLQIRLWFGEGSLAHVMALDEKVTRLNADILVLEERNRLQSAEVDDLKQGLGTIEEIARKDLGMIKKGETFYQVIESPQADNMAEQEDE